VAYLRGEATYTSAETLKIEDEILQSTSRLGFTWQIFEAAVASDYDEIFARLAAEHFDAAYLPGSPLSIRNGTRIGQLALRHRIPTVSGILSWVKDSGHLLAYGQDASWNQVRALGYVDKVLRGAKPSDLPVEQPTNLDLVINVKTAKVLGLTVPSSLLARAVEVIE
jgi:putative tryptophan/tyrosine transport system substrate-binding protein